MKAKNILIISGRPTSGKTTLIKLICERLQEKRGFKITQKYPANGNDISYCLTNHSGKTVLIHSAMDDEVRIGELILALEDCRKNNIDIDLLITACRNPQDPMRISALSALDDYSSIDPERMHSHKPGILEVPLTKALAYDGDYSREWRDAHMLLVLEQLIDNMLQ